MRKPKTFSLPSEPPGSLHPAGSASGVESETWHEWLKKHHATLDLDKTEDRGMFLAFALVETRLRSIGQYTGGSPTPNDPDQLRLSGDKLKNQNE